MIIHRERLFETLDEARKQAKIIWVAAPGGSGKTTLLSNYIKTKQVAHCWYQVDEDDRDLATFFHYLGLAGKRAAPRKKAIIAKLTPEYQQGIPAFTRQFFSDISSRLKNDGVIVLDNFQLLSESDPVSVLLPNIIESLSSGVSLVIISRHLPPMSMTKFIAKRELFLIDTKQLRFVEKEWLAAGRLFDTRHSEETLLSIHQKLDGWIAGLVLLPDNFDSIDQGKTSGLGIEILDCYIAEQFLSSLNAETSELLMKVCYMPHITATAAKVVSQIPHSKKILSGLAQKNLFVLQQGDKGYTLHPLVREYLIQKNLDSLSDEELQKLRLLTATALLNENEYEAAAELLLELKTWQALVQLIINNAFELHDSGRIESLHRYINALPKEYAEDEPWIVFWKGKLAIYNDANSALNYYDTAYTGFMKKSDIKGIYMSWYSAVSVICSTLSGGTRLTTWVYRYNEFSILYPEPPKRLQKGFIDAILLESYFISGLDPKKRMILHARLASEIDKVSDPSLRLHMASNYIHVALLSGVKESDKAIMEKFERQLDDMKHDLVLYLGALTVCSLSAWSFNDFEKLQKLETKALEIAKENGISVFDCHIYTKMMIAALGLKKFDLARQYHNIMKENVAKKNLVSQALYFVCTVAAGTYMKEASDLEKTAEYYSDILESTHLPPFILHNKLFYVYYLCVHKKSDTALALHDDLLRKTEKLALPAQSSRFYMIYAKIYYDKGDVIQSNHYLNKSFSAARQGEILTYANWHPELMAWACQRALLLEIEATYVNQFIEIHYINLPSPDSKDQHWPWPFYISTFGGFELKTRNNMISPGQRGGKSIALLKALVKTIDRHLSTEAIKEILYVDEKHEKTAQLLDTQIHRLRKFLGNEKTIIRNVDNISINLKYFWIDTCEFEMLGKQKITNGNALKIAKRLQELYKGEYFPGDDTIEIIARRERYRNMYLAILFKCIDHINIKTDTVIELCRNALILEPLSEPLYRKLISIYLKQDNRDMAEATLEQCRKLVKTHLDSDVSNETLSLLKTATACY